MVARSPHEAHRAVDAARTALRSRLRRRHRPGGGGPAPCDRARPTSARARSAIAMVFFAIWWAWMNFTWFASAYDCDDVAYRLRGVRADCRGARHGGGRARDVREPHAEHRHGRRLRRHAAGAGRRSGCARRRPIPNAGRPRAATPRASRSAAGVGRHALRAAAGGRRDSSPWLPLELLVPVWAERAAPTTWHPHHIAERYGLLTLIVLGESILAATLAVQSALRCRQSLTALRRSSSAG